ncbi:DUF202 domain-containing protein [Nocardioides sambongensis]|uniref:DUF202 domain-containing protein n=1 Tax=Nocardioides sambongensis TaxID=2589074 RepID=UPI001127F762|nr:DUF202 domain-containing protein [Nocardioides sambongensis]
MVTDTGLSNERTALAWQRTALSLMVAAAVMGRLTFGRLGLVAVGPLGIATVLSAWVFLESRGRYEDATRRRLRPRPRGGRAPLALAVAVVLIGATEIAAFLTATET